MTIALLASLAMAVPAARKDVYPVANTERHLGDLTGVGNTLYFWAVGGTVYFASSDYTGANPRGQELWKAVP